ncbi:AAA family ATPase [Saccharolobus sp. E5-1-F]|uniref:AAA family ATPase n=1 Tax=Saccharolobus sp. E5-1-F TaxID=2663019 RepID=UPI001386E108|nr:AAA family ATPase [Sulfolobus sp. E5-1-F]
MYKKVRIKNFKSLYDVELDIRKVNVVVGPNGSGKSNLVQVFMLLREIIRPSSYPPLPFLPFGGYDKVVYMHDTSKDVSIDIVGDDFEYSLTFNGKEHTINIKKEFIRYKDFTIEREDELIKVDGKEIKENRISPYNSVFSLVQKVGMITFSNLPVQLPHDIMEFMANFGYDIIVLRVIPEIAISQVPNYFPLSLRVDGYGLAKLLYLTRLNIFPFPTIKHESAESIPIAIKRFLDENNMRFDFQITQDGSIMLIFKEKIGDKEITLVPQAVPSGVAKMLVILSAIYLLNPKLLIIDEVENHLHLKFIEELTDHFKFSNPQFIITTHSPLVIDLYDPSDIVLLSREGFDTKAERIKNSKELTDKLIDLGVSLSDWIFGFPK